MSGNTKTPCPIKLPGKAEALNRTYLANRLPIIRTRALDGDLHSDDARQTPQNHPLALSASISLSPGRPHK